MSTREEFLVGLKAKYEERRARHDADWNPEKNPTNIHLLTRKEVRDQYEGLPDEQISEAEFVADRRKDALEELLAERHEVPTLEEQQELEDDILEHLKRMGPQQFIELCPILAGRFLCSRNQNDHLRQTLRWMVECGRIQVTDALGEIYLLPNVDLTVAQIRKLSPAAARALKGGPLLDALCEQAKEIADLIQLGYEAGFGETQGDYIFMPQEVSEVAFKPAIDAAWAAAWDAAFIALRDGAYLDMMGASVAGIPVAWNTTTYDPELRERFAKLSKATPEEAQKLREYFQERFGHAMEPVNDGD